MNKNKMLISVFIGISSMFLLTGCSGAQSINSLETGAFDNTEIAMDSVDGDFGMTNQINTNAMSKAASAENIETPEMSEEIITEPELETDVSGEVEEEITEEGSETERKLIQTVYLTLQTKEFDKFTKTVPDITTKYNGYIESSDIDGVDIEYSYAQYRNANFTVRIPKENVDNFLKETNSLGTIRSKSENTEDITLNYYDSKAQKDALEIEQERLMTILEKAESIDQIVELEKRLSEIRYQINNLGSNLRLMDNKVDYSTIHISVQEVLVEVTPQTKEKTVFDEIKENWSLNISVLHDVIRTLSVNMVSNLGVIFLEILLVTGLIIAFIICMIDRKKRLKRLEKEEIENSNKEKNADKKDTY